MDIRGVFGANLRRLREAADLSQEELAHRAELHRTYIGSLERSQYNATIVSVARIAKQLGVEPWQMLVPVQSEQVAQNRLKKSSPSSLGKRSAKKSK